MAEEMLIDLNLKYMPTPKPATVVMENSPSELTPRTGGRIDSIQIAYGIALGVRGFPY